MMGSISGGVGPLPPPLPFPPFFPPLDLSPSNFSSPGRKSRHHKPIAPMLKEASLFSGPLEDLSCATFLLFGDAKPHNLSF